ncbi:threonine synthase [Natronoarchaeum mannanilyticum]|uniref:Threonine synthase n=1 Tax=Natronoarchaeum mannanilyticum TaxID=926360 RepID=A0AAV3TB98_9EURY
MQTSDAFAGLECQECGERFDAADERSSSSPDSQVRQEDETAGRCPDCGGALAPTYDYDAIDLDRETLADRPFGSQWRYRELLPFERSAAVSIDEGGTPLVEAASLADELGVGELYVKDDGRNPTGSTADRGQSVAVTAARERGVDTVALASTGDGGQSAAAYAARAGLDAEVFVPSRATFTNKAMVNVHDGEMTVVGGRVGDALEAAAESIEEEGWHDLGWFATPYRHEGAKTALFEIVEQLAWELPDAVVVPTGAGVGAVGVHRAATELERLGLIDETPAIYAAQAAGCAPIVDAWEAGRDEVEPVEYPDTICGGIEIPDPPGGSLALDAVAESGGGAVATEDPDILDSAVAVAANEGLEVGASAAAAVSGAWELSRRGEFDDSDTVVVLNTGAGSKSDDVLRSHLMGQGI